jgi:hypothetical protein
LIDEQRQDETRTDFGRNKGEPEKLAPGVCGLIYWQSGRALRCASLL